MVAGDVSLKFDREKQLVFSCLVVVMVVDLALMELMNCCRGKVQSFAGEWGRRRRRNTGAAPLGVLSYCSVHVALC